MEERKRKSAVYWGSHKNNDKIQKQNVLDTLHDQITGLMTNIYLNLTSCKLPYDGTNIGEISFCRILLSFMQAYIL